MQILKRVRKTIETHAMLAPGDRVLVAVSGGADSVALLRLLVWLSGEYRLGLTVAHLNHGLRGAESDRDERFVRALCVEIGIDSLFGQADVGAIAAASGCSIEEAGREERYRFLHEAARQCGANRIATGHHRGDQAETVLMRLLRGSGPEGLRGILPVRDGRIIRPLIDVGRSAILDFLARGNFPYVVDSSNRSEGPLRNRVRNRLLPDLAANGNPALEEALCHTAGVMRLEDDFIREAARNAVAGWGIAAGPQVAVLPVRPFCELHAALQARIVKGLLEAASPRNNGIGGRHVAMVLELCRRPERGLCSLDLPFGIRVESEAGAVRIIRGAGKGSRGRKDPPARPAFEYPVSVPSTIPLCGTGSAIRFELVANPGLTEIKGAPRTGFIDYARLVLPLTLRNARPGDRIDLLGRGGTKRLKEYFIDRKIPRERRMQIPILTDAESVVWIAGERISGRVHVTARTRRVLKAEMV